MEYKEQQEEEFGQTQVSMEEDMEVKHVEKG